MNLTRRQREILDFIQQFVAEHGYSPSMEEIAGRFEIASVNAVFKHLAALEKRGCIHRASNRARSIRVLEPGGSVALPLLGFVAAGSPIEAVRTPEVVSVPEGLTSRGGRNYVLRVRGDSMIDEHIEDGDLVVVEERTTAGDGDMVIALLDGDQATLKRFYREGGRIRLQPSNPQYHPILIEADRVQIQGIVIGVMRRYR